MNPRVRTSLAAIAMLLLAGLAGCGDDKQKVVGAQPLPPAVTVTKVASQDVRPFLTFTGRVEAIDKVDLRARIEGFLEKRLFTEGGDVKEGDLLFVIEQASYKASVDQTKATIEKAEAELKLADIEVERQTELVARQAGAQVRLDQAIAQQGQARGEVAAQKAALEKAELNLSYTEIRAPIAGRIGRSLYSVGNYVGPSSGPLATIVSQDPIYVSFPVTQREMLDVRRRRAGEANPAEAIIQVQLADGSRYPYAGKIDFVDVKVNPGTDTVQVRSRFPNPKRILVDGQLVTVIAERGEADLALLIPQAAVQLDQVGPFVLVVDSANKIEVRRIEAEAGRGAQLIVRKGLAAGERVVTEGIQKVRPGQIVQPSEVKPEA